MYRLLLSLALLAVAFVTLASPDLGRQIAGAGNYQVTIGGTVTGLSGSGLVLQNNGGDDLAVSADGTFTFATALNASSAYSITVQTQPTRPSQTCSVINGSGTTTNANVTNVVVVCTTETQEIFSDGFEDLQACTAACDVQFPQLVDPPGIFINTTTNVRIQARLLPSGFPPDSLKIFRLD